MNLDTVTVGASRAEVDRCGVQTFFRREDRIAGALWRWWPKKERGREIKQDWRLGERRVRGWKRQGAGEMVGGEE